MHGLLILKMEILMQEDVILTIIIYLFITKMVIFSLITLSEGEETFKSHSKIQGNPSINISCLRISKQ